MDNFRLFATYPHGDHVDPVLDFRTPVAGQPDQSRAAKLLQLMEVDGADRAAKVEVGSRFYFDERDGLASLDYKVQVAVSAPESVLEDAPAATAQPSRGNPFA